MQNDTGKQVVLIVDDEESIRQIVRQILELMGHEVLEAENGFQGLQVWEAKRGTIDLIISDDKMPRMSGRELTARIKAVDPSAIVLAFSGTASKADFPEADEFIIKPFKLAEMRVAIARLLASGTPEV